MIDVFKKVFNFNSLSICLQCILKQNDCRIGQVIPDLESYVVSLTRGWSFKPVCKQYSVFPDIRTS